jgi:hypothetical protein
MCKVGLINSHKKDVLEVSSLSDVDSGMISCVAEAAALECSTSGESLDWRARGEIDVHHGCSECLRQNKVPGSHQPHYCNACPHYGTLVNQVNE